MARYVKLAAVGDPAIVTQPPANLDAAVDWMVGHWRRRLERALLDEPDLLVVPECCDRFSAMDKPRLKEFYGRRGDRVYDLFAELARRHRCNLAYSAVRHVEGDTWANSVRLIGRDGSHVGTYDKNHPTIGEIESGIRPGTQQPIFQTDIGRVCFAICFDLNFDELRLAYVRQRPELVVFSSMYHGGLMQAYWAYSCRSHFLGAVAGLPCQAINPVGHTMATSTNYHHEVCTTVNLDCTVVHLDYNIPRLAEMKKKYGPEVSVFDPGLLAPVLVSSESDKRTVAELVSEFELEQIDPYFERARMERGKALGE